VAEDLRRNVDGLSLLWMNCSTSLGDGAAMDHPVAVFLRLVRGVRDKVYDSFFGCVLGFLTGTSRASSQVSATPSGYAL
jgi:hypothetical protein